MKCIRVAILGQGRSGFGIHAAHLKADTRRYKVVAVVDPISTRRDNAIALLGCEAFESFQPLLERRDIDLVVNATPSRLHVPLTRQFMEAGFNVLCEKPLASRAADVDMLIETARRKGVVFAVFQQARYAPYFQRIRKLLESGRLGRIVQVSICYGGFSRRYDWQTVIEEMGGALLNTGPHPLDQALQLMGGEAIPSVTCYMRQTVTLGDADDHVRLVMTLPDAPVAEIEISSCRSYPGPLYRIIGTHGGLTGSATALEWRFFKPEEAPEHQLDTHPISKPDGSPCECEDVIRWRKGKWQANPGTKEFDVMSARFYRMLHAALTKGAPLEITPEQVRRQIAIIEECQRQNPHLYKPEARKHA